MPSTIQNHIFARCLNSSTDGISLHILRSIEFEEAKKLLMQPTVNVKEVGIRVGYPDSTYFARVFRRMTGESPSEYRMRFLKEL